MIRDGQPDGCDGLVKVVGPTSTMPDRWDYFPKTLSRWTPVALARIKAHA